MCRRLRLDLRLLEIASKARRFPTKMCTILALRLDGEKSLLASLMYLYGESKFAMVSCIVNPTFSFRVRLAAMGFIDYERCFVYGTILYYRGTNLASVLFLLLI